VNHPPPNLTGKERFTSFLLINNSLVLSPETAPDLQAIFNQLGLRSSKTLAHVGDLLVALKIIEVERIHKIFESV